MIEIIQQLFGDVSAVYQLGGYVAAIAVGLKLLVGVYRRPEIQGQLPAQYRWLAMPLWLRYLIPFALAFAVGLIMSLSSGATWVLAIGAALTAGLGVIGVHKSTKAIGQVEAKLRGLDHTYKVTPARDWLSIGIPVDKRLHAPVIDQETPKID